MKQRIQKTCHNYYIAVFRFNTESYRLVHNYHMHGVSKFTTEYLYNLMNLSCENH